jgi:hypothetical protein
MAKANQSGALRFVPTEVRRSTFDPYGAGLGPRQQVRRFTPAGCICWEQRSIVTVDVN